MTIPHEDRSPIAVVTLITKRGLAVPRPLTDRLLKFQYVDSGKRRTTRVEVTLENEDEDLLYDEELMRKGAILSVQYGYPGLMVDAGDFVVKQHKGTKGLLTLTAHERKRSKMVRKRYAQTWKNVTRAEVVRQVLARHGFTDKQIHVDHTPEVMESITQRNEHDWQFLHRLAREQGAWEFYLDQYGIHWEKPKRNQKPSRLMRYIKNPVGVGEILNYSFDGVAANIPGRVRVQGRDPVTKQDIDVLADADTVDDWLPLVDTDNGDTPEEGDREDRGDTGHEVVLNIGSRTVQEAKQLASAYLKEARYGALKLSLTVVGDPLLRSRRIIAVWGLGAALDGLYWVKEVSHAIGAGYECSLSLTREGLAKRLGGGKRAKPKEWNLWHEFRETRKRGGSLREYHGPYARRGR